MKELVKKFKEVESKRNVIAGKSRESREKLMALKSDDSRHELAIQELQKTRPKILYADLGELQKKIAIHEQAQERLMDNISDSEYTFSVCKRQLITLDAEMVSIKRQLFGAIAADLVKQVSPNTKTLLLEIYTSIQMSGLRPAPQDIFDMLFGKSWDHTSMRDVETGIMKKFNLT